MTRHRGRTCGAFPRHRCRPVQEPLPDEVQKLGGLSGLSVLVVDDLEDHGASVCMLLELWGATYRFATGAEAALKAARAAPPDVVLLDLGLPGMDGYQLGRALRQARDDGGPALIAVSGFGQPEYRRRCAEEGFDGFLLKPADPADLYDAIARAAAGFRPAAWMPGA